MTAGAPTLDALGLPVDDDWLRLYDLDLRPSDPRWPRLHTVAYQGLAGAAVKLLAPDTEADPAALLLSFLAAVGSAIGPGPHAAVGSAPHPGRLNVLLVGDTSRARKGTSWAEVGRVMAEADQAWAEERVVGGLASGEGLITRMQKDDGDVRLLVVEPEFARTLAVCARDGSTLSAVLRQAWDTGDLRVMTRKDPLSVTGAHVSVLGHITVEELRRRMCDTEVANGFANRFLMACTHRARLLPTGGELDQAAVAALGRQVAAALDRARKLGRVRRSAIAESRWAQLYRNMADGPRGLAGAITARAEAQCLRLSVVYALLDGRNVIDIEHLEAAYAVWQFCEASAVYVFGDALGDDTADRLLEALRTAGAAGLDGSAQRDLFSRHVSADRLRHARATLIRLGLAVERTEQTAGRPRLLLYCAESVLSAESRDQGKRRPGRPPLSALSRGNPEASPQVDGLKRLERFQRTGESDR